MPAIVHTRDTEGTRRFLAHKDGSPIVFANGHIASQWFEKNQEAFLIDVDVNKSIGPGWMDSHDPLAEDTPKPEHRPYCLKDDSLLPDSVRNWTPPPKPTLSELLGTLLGVNPKENGFALNLHDLDCAAAEAIPNLFAPPKRKKRR
ncbi:MAG: hypothetical protein Q8P30_00675 [Candidatus Uhrbacteria bacterium]|nr:hypothetical protein [Candidatus Uhrbacteria bacterium]